MSESTSNLSKPQLAMALGAAATVILAGGLYWRMKGSTPKKNEPQAVPVGETPRPIPKAEPVPDLNDENYKKAQQLKEEGNTFFKERKYDLAIKAYTEALALTDIDSHLLFSNRSAAYTFNNMMAEAMQDAKTCIQLKPEWSKGYFRLGKALHQKDDISEAFINFYKGLLLEPKSEELRKMVEQTRVRLPPFGERAFKFQFQAKVLTYYMLEVADQLCSDVGMTRSQVEAILADAINTKSTDKIYEKNEEIKAAYQRNQTATLQILVILLLVGFEKPALALPFADDLLLIDREDAQSLILCSLVKIRVNNNIFGRMEEATAILDLIRDALVRNPDDIFITNTYMGFISTLVQFIGTPDSPLDVPTILKELKIVLSHPKGDKLQIAHTGVQIWFKFFEDPQLQQRLMIEEREAESLQLNAAQAYLRGIMSGAFRNIVMDPFFLQAMSDVLLPFPQLERILGPFRSAILQHLNVDSPTEFESLVNFIHALSIQLYRCNYLWEIKEEDKDGIDTVKKLIEKQLKDVEKAAPEGVLPRKLYQQLSIYAMFHSLSTISGIEDLALKLDFSKLPANFVTLINKSVLAEGEERDIKDSIVALTAIPDTDLVHYFNSHISPVWDSPPLSVLTPVTVQTELKLRYPYYNSNLPKEGKIKVLIAACGSGREVYQVYSTYKDVEITAIDISEANLAYAIRQNKELGVEGVKYYLADVLNLTPGHFPSLFDIVIANDFLHYCTDPVKAWEKLSALVKPGGLFMGTLHNKKLVNAITKMRTMLVSAFKPPLFDQSPSPKLLRFATDEEVREARRLVLDSLDQTRELPAELMDLVTSLGFYSLNEYRDLVFHPIVTGFTFTTVNKLINQLGLKLVGFDFPEIYYEKELSYKGEFYNDRAMVDGPSLDAFDAKDSSAFAGFYISFTCEKPL